MVVVRLLLAVQVRSILSRANVDALLLGESIFLAAVPRCIHAAFRIIRPSFAKTAEPFSTAYRSMAPNLDMANSRRCHVPGFFRNK